MRRTGRNALASLSLARSYLDRTRLSRGRGRGVHAPIRRQGSRTTPRRRSPRSHVLLSGRWRTAGRPRHTVPASRTPAHGGRCDEIRLRRGASGASSFHLGYPGAADRGDGRGCDRLGAALSAHAPPYGTAPSKRRHLRPYRCPHPGGDDVRVRRNRRPGEGSSVGGPTGGTCLRGERAPWGGTACIDPSSEPRGLGKEPDPALGLGSPSAPRGSGPDHRDRGAGCLPVRGNSRSLHPRSREHRPRPAGAARARRGARSVQAARGFAAHSSRMMP